MQSMEAFMEDKKQILLLTTGGTIASAPGGDGLEPQRWQIMSHFIDQLREFYHITVREVMCLDSSNIRPKEWQQLASHIYEAAPRYDGIVVSHGTDTMAYTASALTFMLPGLSIPVVFTGSQVPLQDPLSDGPDNMRTAFAMAASGCGGVFVAFDRRIVRGCRAVKVRATGFSAFESINAQYVGQVSGHGLEIRREMLPAATGPLELKQELSRDVFLLKLTPGMNPAIFDALVGMGVRGIVIEAFGLGGVNVLGEGMEGIEKAIEAGVSVVVTTQCLYDSADLGVYQVGTKLLELGVIQGRDMTSEAAVAKLMWALGQGMTPDEIKVFFAQSVAGEISL